MKVADAMKAQARTILGYGKLKMARYDDQFRNSCAALVIDKRNVNLIEKIKSSNLRLDIHQLHQQNAHFDGQFLGPIIALQPNLKIRYL